MNKKRAVVILLIIIVIISITIFLIKTKNNGINTQNNYQRIFSIGTKDSDLKSYLGYYDGYYYYGDGFKIDDIYVVQSESLQPIDSSIIKTAQENILDGQKVFMIAKEKYNIENLFDAIYLQDESIAVFFDELESIQETNIILKEKASFNISLDSLDRLDDSDKFTRVFSASNGGAIYLKNIEITMSVNEKTIKNDELIELANNNCTADQIFSIIDDKYTALYEDSPLSEELISTTGYEYNNDEYLVVEKKKNNDRVDYYIYLEDVDEFKARLGF